ncbi:hypothetical protein [Kushneria phosphatilytica]|uniref:hypothetical protein n=1 Tax=Kushneria phosphatilytica TaxID=657387 RepID=UPI0008D9D0D5|nr:hypothetical protein [Kushneria phosphatilytica]OHV12960.1 hypothetical protein BH688_02865 [Kushneria phosphatilytica]
MHLPIGIGGGALRIATLFSQLLTVLAQGLFFESLPGTGTRGHAMLATMNIRLQSLNALLLLGVVKALLASRVAL